MFLAGAYLEASVLPARLGYEVSGEVEAIGAGVTGFVVGDAVSTVPALSMNQYGVYGDAAIVPIHAVVKNPARLSWVQAAAIWTKGPPGAPPRRRAKWRDRGAWPRTNLRE